MSVPARQKVVYTIAGLGIALALYVQFGVQVKKPDIVASTQPLEIAGVPADVAQPVASSVNNSGQPVIFAQAAVSLEMPSGWGGDPFAPRAARNVSLSPRSASDKSTVTLSEPVWRLGGIIYLPAKPVAYINDHPVHVGQNIDGAVVTEITPHTVLLNYRGERKTLTLGKG